MNKYCVYPHEDGWYEEGVQHIQLAYAPYPFVLAAFEVTSLLGVEGISAPSHEASRREGFNFDARLKENEIALSSCQIPAGLNSSYGDEWFNFQGRSLPSWDAFSEGKAYSSPEIVDFAAHILFWS